MEYDIDKILEEYFTMNLKVYDRFTFDRHFRDFLKLGFDHEGAKDLILYNCCLSALVLQERIHNGYYLKISEKEKMSQDLIELRNEIFVKKYPASLHN